MRLEGKAAIITGAASGIGRGVALKFAREGAGSLLVDANEPGNKETALLCEGVGGKAVPMAADLRDRKTLKAIVARAVREFGALDILVNNAGVARTAFYPDFSTEDLDLVLEVNLKAPYFLAQHAARYMSQHHIKGRIVNISSINAEKAVVSGSTAYCASKGAIRQFTRAAAVDLGPYGITINAVGPGHTRTGMSGPGLEANAELEAEWASKTPLDRIGEPEDIANMVAYLASDEASYVTGQSFYVDGGRNLWS